MSRLDFYVDYKLYLSIKLRFEELLIGRTSDCDLILCDNRVSRKHAMIQSEGSIYYLKDLSKNGTRVNDHLITDRGRLSPGDRIYIQDYIIIYQPEGAAPTDLSQDVTIVN